MKYFNLLIFISILFVSIVIAGGALSNELAADKETMINSLIKTENENKLLHSGAKDLLNFSRAIEGEDRLDCLEKRCVNEGQLMIKITGNFDENISINIDLGTHDETTIKQVNPNGNRLNFKGTLGNQYVSQLWAKPCYEQRMTRLTLKNNGHSPIVIDAVELLLDNGNNVIKPIFEVDQPSFNLVPRQEKKYTMAEIKNNSAYQNAKVAACQD